MHTALQLRLIFFIVMSLLAIAAPLIVFSVTNEPYLRIVISLLATFILWLAFRISTPRDASDNKVRLAVLATTSSLFLAVLQFKSAPDSTRIAVNELFAKFSIPFQISTNANDAAPDFFTFAFLAAIVLVGYLILRGLRAPAPMGLPDQNISDVLPNVTNLDRLSILKETLRNRIDQLDHLSRWSEGNYVSLQAEVQILEGKSSRRKIVDLLSALRNDQRTRIFVILGDPGTGKSVALRKLARDLLITSHPSDRIPIYVNLKEWRAIRDWTPEHPPTVEEFHNFVKDNILNNLDFNSESFLLENDTFRRLLEAGYFFFIFDSFDEIPAVLDHEENSWLIDSLSSCITTYALGGQDAKAIIASRLFRKPKILHHLRSVLEIRPFSDDRIVQAIQRAANSPTALKRIILAERKDLGSIARNPFLLNLIISHFNAHGTAPRSQAEMFDTFFRTNLALARGTYRLKDISDEEVYQTCEDIAGIMFSSPNIGLEIADTELSNRLHNTNLPQVLRFLAQARIARIGGSSGAFSFSHRRFNEYFLVRRLLNERTPIPYDAIHNDSRWRDALVLFAEIAPDDVANTLRSHAWQYCRGIGELSLGSERDRFVQARNALRFLIDGFKNRPSIIEPINRDLSHIISSKLLKNTDYIEKKTVVEALALLPIRISRRLILLTLRRYPGWISEQAASSARYLPRIDENLTLALYQHCTQRRGLEGIKEARRQEPIFAISDAFHTVSRSLLLFRWQFYKSTFILVSVIGYGLLTQNNTVIIPFLMSLFILIFSMISISWAEMKRNVTRTSKELGERSVSTGSPSLFLKMALTVARSSGLTRLRVMMSNALVSAHTLVPFLLAMTTLFMGLRVLSPSQKPSDILIKNTLGIPYFPPSHSLYENCIILVVMVAGLIPISPIVWSQARLFYRKTIRKLSVRRSIILLASFSIFILSGYLIGMLIEYAIYFWPELQYYIPITIFALFGVTLMIVLQYFFALLRDVIKLRKLMEKFSPSRRVISADFRSLVTNFARERYVAWLERESIHFIGSLRDEHNTWPDGLRPQYMHDRSSEKLAQLDARWLDLE